MMEIGVTDDSVSFGKATLPFELLDSILDITDKTKVLSNAVKFRKAIRNARATHVMSASDAAIQFPALLAEYPNIDVINVTWLGVGDFSLDTTDVVSVETDARDGEVFWVHFVKSDGGALRTAALDEVMLVIR